VTQPAQRQPGLLAPYWVFGALMVALTSPHPVGWLPATAPDETYYVIAHSHYMMSLGVWFLICAAVYLFLDTVGRRQYRRGLGLAHFGLTFAGTLLILSPRLTLSLIGTPHRSVDPMSAITMANAVAHAGYAMTLIGLFIFVIMLIDALVRRLRAPPKEPGSAIPDA